MPASRHTHRRTTAIAARAAAGFACIAVLATGCSTESLLEEGVERAIEEGASGDADVEFDSDGSISVENEDGSFQVGGGDLPEGFPDDVPLVEGEVLTSSRFVEGEETAWSVTLVVEGAASSAFAAAHDELTSAGYDESQSVDSGSIRSATLDNGDFRVNLTALEGPDGATLSYTVTSTTP